MADRTNLQIWSDKPPEEIASIPLKKLKQSDPARYLALVSMLEDGCSFKSIEKATAISRRTIAKVSREEPSLNKGVKALNAKLQRVANQAADRLIEILEDEKELEKINPKDLTVTLGITTDKISNLSASQTPSTAVQVNINAAPDLNKLIQGLPSKKDDKPPIDV